MLEAEVLEKVEKKLVEILVRIPSIKIEKLDREVKIPGADLRPDLVARLATSTGPMTLAVEVKSSGEPRIIRMAAQQLLSHLKGTPGSYGLFAAPYITGEGFEVGREAGIGLMDLSGNCFLNFGQVYLELQGNANLFPKLRFPKSLFSPRSSRIIRVLLSEAGRAWSVQDLAREAGVSLGLVSGIKERLRNYEFIREERRVFNVVNPGLLIKKWSENYSYDKNKLYDFYSFDEAGAMESRIGEYCEKNNLLYALTLFSGAARVAPFTRYTRAFVYLKEGIPRIAEALSLKPVPTGPNVTVMEPYDEGVFYGRQNIAGLWVACNVQIYLDLKNYKGRGEEAAEFLLKQAIEPQWRKEQIIKSGM